MNDNIIQFPSNKTDVEFEFGFVDEIDHELETVKTMLEVQANGIITSSDSINWGHIFDASIYLLIIAGVNSGLSTSAIKEILKNCDVEYADE